MYLMIVHHAFTRKTHHTYVTQLIAAAAITRRTRVLRMLSLTYTPNVPKDEPVLTELSELDSFIEEHDR